MSDYLKAYTASLDTRFNQALLEGNFSEAVNHTALSIVNSQRESEKSRQTQQFDLVDQRVENCKKYVDTFTSFGANTNSAMGVMQTFAPMLAGVPVGASFGAAVNSMKGLNDEGTQAKRITFNDRKDVAKEAMSTLDRESQRALQAIADAMNVVKEQNRANHDSITNMLR
jgi:hypothetical protein